MPRHLNHGRRLGRTSEHRIAMLRNLVSNLFEHGRVVTTVPKAKEARRLAEKCITLAKRGLAAEKSGKEDAAALKLHYYRELRSVLVRREPVDKLFADIAPRYIDRKGGYTRVLKAGFRLGDASPKAVFELV